MARNSMTNLIATIRQLIQDDVAPYSLSDDTIQDVLDRHGQRILRHRLTPVNAGTPNDGHYWVVACAGHWENRDNSLAIKDRDGTVLQILESDLDKGMWRIASIETMDVFLHNGATYDVYGAATECLKVMIAKIKDEYTFSTGEGNFSRSDRIGHLNTLIDLYRRATRPYVLKVVE